MSEKELSRRQLLAVGGVGLAALTLDLRLSIQDQPRTHELPPGKDPAAHAQAENLFWNQIMSDHGMFFAMLMPGKELDEHRKQAEEFHADFQKQLEQVRRTPLTADTFAEFNRTSIEHAKAFSDWKKKMAEEQKSQRIQSLVWPSFFLAASLEADRFVKRLEQINGGSTEFDRTEVLELWAHDAGGHSGMIAHLLDPEETKLVQEWLGRADRWKQIHREKPAGDEVAQAAQEIVDREAALAKGMKEAEIRSIIHPRMIDHMRQEGLRFIEELKRAEQDRG